MRMTVEQVVVKYRRHWLGLMAEVYACRRAPSAEFGQLIDRQNYLIDEITRAMAADLGAEPAKPKAEVTGQPKGVQK